MGRHYPLTHRGPIQDAENQFLVLIFGRHCTKKDELDIMLEGAIANGYIPEGNL